MHATESLTGYPVPTLLYRIHFRSAAIARQFGTEAERFIASYVDIGCHMTEVMATSTVFNIEAMNSDSVHSIVNMVPMNDVQDINAFINAVNSKLPYGGLYIGCIENLWQRRCRVLNKYPKAISYPYYMLDFLVKRVFPKWGPTRKIYKLLTRENNRAVSTTEMLGRLRVFGFSIEDNKEVGKLTFFVVRKIALPVLNTEPHYGMIIRLRRIGKDGKMFDVFKFRTMHPYAEFLQEYVHSKNNLGRGGKFADDFRITSWGRWMRKFWLDELPMWYNWLRGELKLVGVRPLSRQYFALYPAEFQERRIRYTPGLIPPFYVDLPETIEDIVASEIKYLDAYDKHPWLTDIRYFFKALYNIIIKRARSS